MAENLTESPRFSHHSPTRARYAVAMAEENYEYHMEEESYEYHKA